MQHIKISKRERRVIQYEKKNSTALGLEKILLCPNHMLILIINKKK